MFELCNKLFIFVYFCFLLEVLHMLGSVWLAEFSDSTDPSKYVACLRIPTFILIFDNQKSTYNDNHTNIVIVPTRAMRLVELCHIGATKIFNRL